MATKKTAKSAKTYHYDLNTLASEMASIIKDTLSCEEYEDKQFEIDSLVNGIIEDESDFIQASEKNPIWIRDLAHLLTSRNLAEISHVYKKDTETERNTGHERLMASLKDAAFQAYMELDFADITDMLNYRCAEFNKVGPEDKKDESLEAIYIKNRPGDYEPKEIQEYIFWMVQEALKRFKEELDCGMLEEDPANILGEYYNHSSGLYCKVLPDSVEISYIPVSVTTFKE